MPDTQCYCPACRQEDVRYTFSDVLKEECLARFYGRLDAAQKTIFDERSSPRQISRLQALIASLKDQGRYELAVDPVSSEELETSLSE